MEKWKYPKNYMGPDYPGYYVFLSRHRDSDTLTESNFIVASEKLNVINYDGYHPDNDGYPSPINVRHHHWAVGWIEFILIHENDKNSLSLAEEMEKSLNDYPVLDEEHFCNMEIEKSTDYWQSLSIEDRVELCQKYGISIFAARHDYIPSNDGNLDEYLRMD